MHSSNTSVGMPSSNTEFGQIRVHVLYKRAEIPAKAVIPAIALSVTYRKQESPANTGSTPVSATKSFIIIGLQNRRMELGLRRSAKDRGQGSIPKRNRAAIYGGVSRFRAKMSANEVEPPQRRERPE